MTTEVFTHYLLDYSDMGQMKELDALDDRVRVSHYAEGQIAAVRVMVDPHQRVKAPDGHHIILKDGYWVVLSPDEYAEAYTDPA